MTKRWIGSLIAAVVVTGAITACTTDSGGGDSDLPFAGETLTVMNWQGYVSDFDWAVERFEELTGATVEHVYKNSDPDAVNILQNGGIGEIGAAMINHGYIEIMAEQGLLEPLDVSQIPVFAETYPALQDVPAIHYNGEVYGVPWVWGFTTLVFVEDVTGPVDSWDPVWDSSFAGKVAFYDDPQTAVMTSAYHLGLDPADPNLDLDAIKADLIALKPDVALYWSGADEWVRAFSTGQAVIGNGFPATTKQVESPSVSMAIPAQGSVGWLDTWTIVKDAPNPELAKAWIEFMSGEEFQTRAITDEPESFAFPANVNAPFEVFTDFLGTDITADDIPSLDFIAVSPETLEEWTRLWQEVKAS